MRALCLIYFIAYSFFVGAQQFQNPNLEGVVIQNVDSTLPPSWDAISGNEPYCMATDPGVTDTPDLTNNFGPLPDLGVLGIPFSGISFLSGKINKATNFDQTIWHEGISQPVSGFTIDSFYTITFHQSLVKQLIENEDDSGAWSVYIDHQLAYVSEVSESQLVFDDPNLNWGYRAFSFKATQDTHLFSFLPYDDDIDIIDGVRMGIDYIYIRPSCYLLEEPEEVYDLDCGQDSIMLNVSTANGSYQWSTGQTTSSVTVGDGDFRVTITGEGGCVSTKEISVQSNPALFLDLGPDQEICDGNTITLDAAIPDAFYLWQDGSTAQTLNINEAGLYWVETDLSGCVNRDSIWITNHPFNGLSLGPDRDHCPGEELVVTPTPVIPGVFYFWPDGNSNTSYTVSGTETVTVYALYLGCAQRDTVQITSIFTDFSLGPDTTICNDESLLLDATSDNANYLWQDGSTTSTFEVTQGGEYSVELISEDCSTSDTISVAKIDLTPLHLGPDTNLCTETSLELVANVTAADYHWQDQSTSSSIIVDSPGTYWVEASSGDCIEQDTIAITFSELRPFNLGQDTTICAGDSLLFSAEVFNEATYLWSDQSTQTSLWALEAGEYAVSVSLDNCEETASILVDHYEDTVLDLGQDTNVCQEDNFILIPQLSGPNPQYLWQDSTVASSIAVSTSANYQLTVSTLCATVYDEIDIIVENCTCLVYVPNAFSPNNDMLNDFFEIYMPCPITDYELRIYSRKGHQVYFSKDRTQNWDGNFEGQPLNPGVYVYELRYNDYNGISRQKVGDVTLIR